MEKSANSSVSYFLFSNLSCPGLSDISHACCHKTSHCSEVKAFTYYKEVTFLKIQVYHLFSATDWSIGHQGLKLWLFTLIQVIKDILKIKAESYHDELRLWNYSNKLCLPALLPAGLCTFFPHSYPELVYKLYWIILNYSARHCRRQCWAPPAIQQDVVVPFCPAVCPWCSSI